MSGNEFMSEMSSFLESGGDAQFMRPSSSGSSKLKLKKEKKVKKEKKAKKSKKSKRSRKSSGSDQSESGKADADQWVDSSTVVKPTTESWMGIDENMFGSIGVVSTKKGTGMYFFDFEVRLKSKMNFVQPFLKTKLTKKCLIPAER